MCRLVFFCGEGNDTRKLGSKFFIQRTISPEAQRMHPNKLLVS
jgi:hypothetical protein